jgi:hypothetical protein
MTPLGAVTCATVAFRSRGQLRGAAIVKATFQIVPGAAMLPLDPEPLVEQELLHTSGRGTSAARASELAPYLPLCDVLLTGRAHAPGGRPSADITTRLAIARGSTSLLDKRLRVQGARDPRTSSRLPFVVMPLAWELAAFSATDNPVGMPAIDAPIVDAEHPEKPASYGPICSAWPARHGQLGNVDVRALDAPIPTLDGFTWSYFHAAPADQRIDYLQGDEWVVLENLSAVAPRIESLLPGVRGMAKLYGASPSLQRGRALTLALDTLVIDAEAMRCSTLFRASFPIANEAEIPSLRLVGAVMVGGRAPAWPVSFEDAGRPQTADLHPSRARAAANAPNVPFKAPVTRPVAAQPDPLEQTQLPSSDASATAPLPFSPPGRVTAAVAISAPSTRPIHGDGLNQTLGFSVDAPVITRPATPFEGKANNSPRLSSSPSNAPRRDLSRGSTLNLSPADAAQARSAALPFADRAPVIAPPPPPVSSPASTGTLPPPPMTSIEDEPSYGEFPSQLKKIGSRRSDDALGATATLDEALTARIPKPVPFQPAKDALTLAASELGAHFLAAMDRAGRLARKKIPS